MMRSTCISVAATVVVVALVAAVSVHGQELPVGGLELCTPCSQVTCPVQPAHEECTWGRVRDPCYCCDECAKGPGEICGGKNGTCLPGFKCIKRTSAPKGSGRCEWRPLPTFINPKISGK